MFYYCPFSSGIEKVQKWNFYTRSVMSFGPIFNLGDKLVASVESLGKGTTWEYTFSNKSWTNVSTNALFDTEKNIILTPDNKLWQITKDSEATYDIATRTNGNEGPARLPTK